MKLCFCEQTTVIKIQADYIINPIWCNTCSANLGVDFLHLSDDLKKDLFAWSDEYGTWIDLERDSIVENAVELEDAHNVQGEQLTARIQQQLEGQYEVVFSPATFARNFDEITEQYKLWIDEANKRYNIPIGKFKGKN